jgi:hypothetical protein
LKINVKFRDWIIYLGVSLLVVAFVLGYAEHAPPGSDLPRGVWLALITLVMFGYVARAFRRRWQNVKFWAIYVSLFLSHILLWLHLLSRYESHFLFPATLFMGVEFILICLLIEKIAS